MRTVRTLMRSDAVHRCVEKSQGVLARSALGKGGRRVEAEGACVHVSVLCFCVALPRLALRCLALPCLALPCLALPCLALPKSTTARSAPSVACYVFGVALRSAFCVLYVACCMSYGRLRYVDGLLVCLLVVAIKFLIFDLADEPEATGAVGKVRRNMRCTATCNLWIAHHHVPCCMLHAADCMYVAWIV